MRGGVRLELTRLVRLRPFFQLVDVVVKLLFAACTLLEAALLKLRVVSLRVNWRRVSSTISTTASGVRRGYDVGETGIRRFDRSDALDLHSHYRDVEGHNVLGTVLHLSAGYTQQTQVLRHREPNHCNHAHR